MASITRRYRYDGTPQQIGAALQSHQADVAAGAATNQARFDAEGKVLSTLYSQPGQFADAISRTGGNQAQGLGMLGAGYGGVASGYGSVAQAMANERSNFYGANAMAEAARQAALGNVGTGAMAAYGGAGNQALQSQAMQSTAYMKALSDMMASNQSALSGLGRAQVVAGSLPGGGFSATGTEGPIASGSYGTSAGTGGQSALSALSAGDAAYRNQLRQGFESQADVPRQTLADILMGVRGLSNDSALQLGGGMNQFYATQNDPRNRSDYTGALAGLGGLRSGLGQLGSQIRSSGDKTIGALQNLWNKSTGRLSPFLERT